MPSRRLGQLTERQPRPGERVGHDANDGGHTGPSGGPTPEP
jgi:hypothetical protein